MLRYLFSFLTYINDLPSELRYSVKLLAGNKSPFSAVKDVHKTATVSWTSLTAENGDLLPASSLAE